MKSSLITLSAILVSWTCPAQSVELVSGSMHIAPGTTLRLNGPLTFSLQSGTTVINDGLIDLGESATVVEADGAPIQGGGTEVTRILNEDPLNGAEPGGLGLGITATSVTGPITITRGHIPRSFPEGDPSIARWFVVDAPNTAAGTADLVLRYDPVELNGLTAEDLGLFRASDEAGPWSALVSSNTASENTVSASMTAPWSYVTAFDANAPTASPTLFATADLHVWPTLTPGPLVVHALNGRTIRTLEVIDGTGRIVLQPGLEPSSLATMDLSSLASGAYFLRVDGQTTIKLRKE